MLRNQLLSSPEGATLIAEEGGMTSEWYSTTGRETPTSNFDTMGSSAPGSHFAARYDGGRGLEDEDEDDNDDVPLLEELGVRPEQILQKCKIVLSPSTRIDFHMLDDADLAGPVFFCLLLGSCLLLGGNLNSLGYVYGFSVCGCVGLNFVLNLMCAQGISVYMTASVLGYSLLPVILLAATSVILSMRGLLGLILSVSAIGWSTYSAVRMLDAKLALAECYWLIVYPVVLFHSVFALISVF